MEDLNMLKCKNCCYYAVSEMNEFEHCCFTEWGNSDCDVAPCDEPDWDDEYEDVSAEDYAEWSNAGCGIDYDMRSW